ncbi:MAG: YIP1 family protein [Alphaproteobacteria bacterium]|nr:YIP1 family protein [Alphaproteobacteria bacterium]
MDASPWAPPVEEPEPEPVDDDDCQPLLDIFFRPAPTMRWLLRHRRTQGALGIALVNGFLVADRDDGSMQLLVAMVVGPVVGVCALVVNGLVVSLVGRLFDGRGDLADCMVALAWGGMPTVLSRGILLGAGVLAYTGAFDTEALVAVGLAAAFVGVAGWIWGAVWQVVTVAEAHRFGWFESTVTVATPLALYYGAVVGLILMAWMVLEA